MKTRGFFYRCDPVEILNPITEKPSDIGGRREVVLNIKVQIIPTTIAIAQWYKFKATSFFSLDISSLDLLITHVLWRSLKRFPMTLDWSFVPHAQKRT